MTTLIADRQTNVRHSTFRYNERPATKYTNAESEVRHAYLDGFKGKIDSLRKIIAEPNAPYEDDDTSYYVDLFPIRRQLDNARTYVPTYPVRYVEYLKGNNGLQAL